MNQDIGWAIKQLQSGQLVRRTDWLSSGAYLELERLHPTNPKKPDVVIHTSIGRRVFFAGREELLATDWEIKTQKET